VEQIAIARLKSFILEETENKEIIVNFHPDLTEIIRESKYLDRLGLSLPETAMNVTLQVLSCFLLYSFAFTSFMFVNKLPLGGQISQVRRRSQVNDDKLLCRIGDGNHRGKAAFA
jgi:hypothetical protein